MMKYDEYSAEADYRIEILNLIRREKFDFIMPKVMCEKGVDMWIHVIRRGSRDPFGVDFGADRGVFIFTDIGGERVERALFGFEHAQVADESIYDVLSEDEGYITEYVAKHNPKAIAINTTSGASHADGLSYNWYLKLSKLLGGNYSNNFISSESLLTEFRVRRVQSEIIVFAQLCETQRRIMERAYKNIVPGKTTIKDLGIFGQGQLISNYSTVSDYITENPYVIHSDVSSREECREADYIVQKGDFLVWDWGYERIHMNYGVDFKRHAYVLKDDETKLPKGLQHAWDNALKVRETLRRTIKSGKTAGETLDLVAREIEKEGYVYTPYTDTEKDREIVQALGDSEKIGFSMDCHCVGNTGSCVSLGPSIAPFRTERADLMILPNTLIAFEFMIHVWIPEWNERINLNLEDNALITSSGIEALYPREEKITLV